MNTKYLHQELQCKSLVDKVFVTNMLSRLVRVESKLVRGFEEMGINIESDDNWIEINHAEKNIKVNTIGRSLKIILDMANRDLNLSKQKYDLYFKDEFLGQIIIGK
jgi:hypothetical protein